MMATEPPVDTLVDVVPLPTTEPEIEPVLATQNGELDLLNVNGNVTADEVENKRVTSVEDHFRSVDPSVSGGSDNEATKLEWLKAKDGDKGHARAGSLAKKPATFKAVSVNRTFLASKASPSGTSPRLSEKSLVGASTPPGGSSAAPRPRLVAKSGGSRESTPRFSSLNGGKVAPAATPDPSAVWNRNRPPEPKKFTDEELKKYGIHMASRLNEDSLGQNKWADIDDDDDDWAPDAITWGDGTKIALPQTDEQPMVPAPGIGLVASRPVDKLSGHLRNTTHDILGAQPPETTHQLTGEKLQEQVVGNAVGPYSEKLPLQASQAELPPRPAGQHQEKLGTLTLGTKSSSMNAKAGTLPSGKGLVLKNGPQEKPTLIAKPPAPPAPIKSPWATLPPVERASPAAPEPLPLAQAGQPTQPQPQLRPASREPVSVVKELAADDFSRSARRDGASHGSRELFNAQSGRYEPVNGKRLRSEGMQKHPAVLQRQAGGEQPAEPSGAFQTSRTSQESAFGRRRGSSIIGGSNSSISPRLAKATEAAQAVLDGPVDGSQALNAASVPNSGLPNSLSQSGIEASNEHAIADDPPVDVLAVASQPTIDHEYQKKLMKERVELARKRRLEEDAREDAARRERIQKKLDALGPPPEKKSDRKEPSPKENVAKPVQIQQRTPIESKALPDDKTKTADKVTTAPSSRGPVETISKELPSTLEAVAESAGSKQRSADSSIPRSVPPRRLSSSEGRKPPNPWTDLNSRPERPAPWAPGTQQAVRNLWGSPNNDRALGNGTFDLDLGRIPGASGADQPSVTNASLIAPPLQSQGSSQGRQQIPPPIGSRPQRHGESGPDAASNWIGSVGEGDGKIAAERLAQRREPQVLGRGMNVDAAQGPVADAFRQVLVPGDDIRSAISSADATPPQSGPWGSASEEFSRVRLPGVGPAAPPNAGIIGSGNSTTIQEKGQPPLPRSSRFFPSRDVRLEFSVPSEPSRPLSPSPPPPLMFGHPAYEGDIARPHVSLPPEKPVVKLPPSMPSKTAPEMLRAAGRGPALAHQTTPERPRDNWQAKFYSLLNGGKESSSRAVAGDSAGGVATSDPTVGSRSGIVSVPLSAQFASLRVPGLHFFTKPMAEECFEEPDVGSLPQIKLPHVAPQAAWQPALVQNKPLPKRFIVQASFMEPYHFPADLVGGNNTIKIRFPTMEKTKFVALPSTAETTQTPRSRRGGASGAGGSRGSPRRPGGSHPGRGGAAKRDSPADKAESAAASGPTNASTRGGGWGQSTRANNHGASRARHAAASHTTTA